MPSFSVPGGVYNQELSIELTCSTEGAVILYTLDGTPPSDASAIYSGPIVITGNGTTMTIKAVAKKEGIETSGTAEATFTVSYLQVSTPVFNPPADYYLSARTVAITTETSNAAIRYTMGDGTQAPPSETSGTIYTGTFEVASSTTIKAIAYKNQMLPSDVKTAVYSIFVPTADHDMAVTAITYPEDGSTIIPVIVTVTATVANFGRYAEAAIPINLTIYSGETPVYSKSVVINSSASCTETSASFDSWTASEGNYRIVVDVTMAEDDVSENNEKTITFNVH